MSRAVAAKMVLWPLYLCTTSCCNLSYLDRTWQVFLLSFWNLDILVTLRTAVFSNGNLDFRQVTDWLLMVLGERQREAELEKSMNAISYRECGINPPCFFLEFMPGSCKSFGDTQKVGWSSTCALENEIRFIPDSCSILFSGSAMSTLWFTMSTINLPQRKTATAWQHTIQILSACSLYSM